MNPSVLLSGLLLMTCLACLAPRRKAEFEAELKGWVGRPAAEFIRAKEDPVEIRPRPQGGRVYVFVLHKPRPTHRETARFSNSNGTLSSVATEMRAPLLCRLTLEVDADGLILSTRWEGNDCW